MGKIWTHLGIGAAMSLGVLAIATPARAQELAPVTFALPAQSLATSLRSVGQAAGVEIIFASSDVRGRTAPALQGRFVVNQALYILLAGSGLTAEPNGATVIIRGRREASALSVAADGSSDILVTGTRIRGGTPVSPTIVTHIEDLQNAGLPTLADYVRTIPQNFSGGQNPGVGIGVPGFANNNLNSASSLNLRGLGPDATLTLLNGHRLAYGSAVQSIDIAAIPLAALDRIEIVPDGASAIYGSDAVGGVANVILKRDFSGVVTSARLGVATDGGGEQQQYSVVGGTTWGSGGVLLAYDHERDAPIIARQRSYTGGLFPTATLLPFQRRDSLVLAGHQALTADLTLEIDGLYNHRKSRRNFAAEARTPYDTYGILDLASTTTFAVAPRLTLDVGPWEVAASGTYGEDRSHFESIFYFGGALNSDTPGCYCNALISAELSAEGPVLHLPAGDARLAVGGGYRRNRLHAYRLNSSFDFTGVQQSVYGYGELSIPIISPEQGVALVHRLSATAAVRYEDYRGGGNIATPKLGLIYSPTADFDLKGSWGRSYKAPTLYQLSVPHDASLFPASSLGGGRFGTSATALILGSGNSDLRPERARTWSASLTAHPRALEGARLEVSYFNIDYKDRVVSPITIRSQALSNPIYADLVQYTPSAATIADAIADAGTYFFNNTGRAFNAGSVVALIDNRLLNVAVQKLHGVDVQASYRIDLAAQNALTFSGNASWLKSKQQLSAGASRRSTSPATSSIRHTSAREAVSSGRVESLRHPPSSTGSARSRTTGSPACQSGSTA